MDSVNNGLKIPKMDENMLKCKKFIVRCKDMFLGNHQNNGTNLFSNDKLNVIGSIENVLVEPQKNMENIMTTAEDRNSYYHRTLLKRERKRIKWLKRELKRYRHIARHNFKFIRKSDGGKDEHNTTRIKTPSDIPYGYQDEYFPRPVERFGNKINTGQYKVYGPDYDSKDNSENEIFLNTSRTENGNNHIRMYSTVNQIPKNNTYYYPEFIGPIHQPMYNTRFQRIESRPGKITNLPQSETALVQPWKSPTNWRISRQGVLPIPYQLKEPIPGVFEVTPPTIIIRKNSNVIREISTNIPESSNIKKYFQVRFGNINQFMEIEHNPIGTNDLIYSPPHNSVYEDIINGNTLNLGNSKIRKDTKNNFAQDLDNTIPIQRVKEPIYTRDSEIKENNHKQQSKNEQHFVKNYVGSVSNWMPVTVKDPDEDGNDKLPVKEQAFNNAATLPLPNQQHIPLVISHTYSEGETNQMVIPTTSGPEVITVRYPLEDKNNIPASTRQNKKQSLIITKENMRQFYPNGTLIFFNVVDGKANTKHVDNKDLNEIPSVNSNGIIPSRLNNISVLVSSSMLVKQDEHV